ncbi:MAG: ABC transporter substrate-binding protein [Pseudomonadota bacterium]
MRYLLAIAALFMVLTTARAAEEPPGLAAEVAAGRLPPLAERLPDLPRSDLPQRADWRMGRYGGSLRTLTRTGRDPRDLSLLGYARLVVWDESFALRPDILAAVDVEAGRQFTLRLRPGHKWSGGRPFTSEDFRFWWQDIATNPALSPNGPPAEMLVAGQAPRFQVIDETTVRYSWPAPNPRFLPALAATSPLTVYAPAHYLKPFHLAHAPAGSLAAEGWAERFRRLDRPFTQANPARPSLQPWINTTKPPAERYIGRRNPFFHRVDSQGRQLPYIDEVIIARTQAKLIPAQAAAGASDLQARGLALADVPLLKAAEAEGKIALRLWPIGRGSQLALYPNLNAADGDLRALLREADFRRALSLAIDREELAGVLYQGLGLPGANTVLPQSPLYRPALRAAWSDYDPAMANRMLDGLGLVARDGASFRRLPDGRRLALLVEAGDSDPREIDALELITETWAEVGLELVIRSSNRQTFRRRIARGEAPLSIFYGLANGLARPSMNPRELAPSGERQPNWPQWGLYAASAGQAGAPPDLPAAERLVALYEAWSESSDVEKQADAWEEMLEINAQEVFSIGLVGALPQPVVSNPGLRNLPDSAPYLYQPGAYFGITRPDTYWFAPP